jgi:hypothetical protein
LGIEKNTAQPDKWANLRGVNTSFPLSGSIKGQEMDIGWIDFVQSLLNRFLWLKPH